MTLYRRSATSDKTASSLTKLTAVLRRLNRISTNMLAESGVIAHVPDIKTGTHTIIPRSVRASEVLSAAVSDVSQTRGNLCRVDR